MASVFSKIVHGELPCYQIFEDDLTLSFLSIAPINPGHTLVIPKQEIDSFLEVPPELYQKVMQHCQMIGHAVLPASGKSEFALLFRDLK